MKRLEYNFRSLKHKRRCIDNLAWEEQRMILVPEHSLKDKG
jgi:hypothetical protein